MPQVRTIHARRSLAAWSVAAGVSAGLGFTACFASSDEIACTTGCVEAGPHDASRAGDDAVDGAASADSAMGNDSGSPDSSTAFAVHVDPSAVVLAWGASATIAVTISGDAAGAIAVSVSGLPANVTASPVTFAGGAGALILTAAPGAPVPSVSSTLTVTASAPAGTVSATLGLTVVPGHGALDTTFGVDGMMTTDFAGDYDEIYGLAITPTGLVAAGLAFVGGKQRFAVAAYGPDGTLDTSFGHASDAGAPDSGIGGGRIAVSLGGPDSTDSAAAVLVQPDGKIVVSGSANRLAFALVRYNADGTRDASFGTNGLATLPLTGIQNTNSVVLARQSDGKIVVAGARSSGGGNDDLLVARFTDHGVLDSTFGPADAGTPGAVVHDLGGSYDEANAIAIQPDGKILVAGTTSVGDNASTIGALTRLNVDGSFDSSFGGEAGGNDAGVPGVVRSFFGDGYEGAWALSLLPSGQSLVVLNTESQSEVARVGTTGSIDTAFGTGTGRTTRQSGFLRGLAVQGDGKIVAGGSLRGSGGSDGGWGLVRFDANGVIDPTFGNAGAVITNFGRFKASANAVSIQADGRILIAGTTATTNVDAANDFTIARFWP